jgi:hypothetical protein
LTYSDTSSEDNDAKPGSTQQQAQRDSNKLRSLTVINWLKSRCAQKAKTQTMLTRHEIERNKDII